MKGGTGADDGRRRRDAARALLAWFARHAREMEWRETDDPYRIWVSEIMLQQTRVDTVLPYYRRFLAAFPSVQALAAASEDEVLKAWEGLGYYGRARNLLRAAQVVVREHGGRIPEDPGVLAGLPGIGPSTAGAIAAIAFGRDAPILDANVRRVVARLDAVTDDVRRPAVARRLWEISRSLVLPGKGRETALAMMDLGATVCTPRKPACGICPVNRWCEARARGIQEEVPLRTKRPANPVRVEVAAVLTDPAGNVLVRRRPSRGLLGGLWEFPAFPVAPGETDEEALRRGLRESGLAAGRVVPARIAEVRHVFSHFTLHLHAWHVPVARLRVPASGDHRATRPEDLSQHAFPRAHQTIVEKFLERGAR